MQIAAALDGLNASQRTTLLDVLSQVDPQVVRDWSDTGKLREWVQQGLRIFAEKKARGERLLAAFFAATPVVLPVLTQGEIGEWVRLALDLEAAEGPEAFSVLPSGLADLETSERLSCYRIGRAAVYRSPQMAAALYRALPHSLQPHPTALRGLLLRCLQTTVAFDPQPLPALLPLIGPTLRTLPPESRVPLLERIAQLAQTFPAGVARLFRTLPRAYEEVGVEGVKTWIVAGEEIARKNARAGEAFFALESRTSLLMLRRVSPAVALSDVQGLLHKYIHMLCGVAISLQETDFLFFPPPLAEDAGDVLSVPSSIEVFPTYEENFRLYRVLAAHQAGRLEFGTYTCSPAQLWPALPPFVHDLVGPEDTLPEDLAAYFQLFPRREQIEALFLLIEGKRIASRLATAYRGLQEDLTWAESLTEFFPPVLSALLQRLPDSLWPNLSEDATAYDSILLATELYAPFMRPLRQADDSPLSESAAELESAEEFEESMEMTPISVADEYSKGSGLSSEELAELYRRIAELRAQHKQVGKKVQRRRDQLVVFDLRAGATESEQEEEESDTEKLTTARRRHTATGLRYFYDEWDYVIEDYRTQWCQLREFPLHGDTGGFFNSTLLAYADLIPDIKREFQRLRPRLYHKVTGLEDGEEIDLNAAVAARVDLRTGISPSPKLYAARQAMERDVAALFLLDMSASTDTLLVEREGARIIDVMKEAIVLLSTALEDIGDTYAIYGFSSHGRRNVEIYPVKTFVETLSPEVKGRISALTPKRSTRMGAAVRHATRKLKDLSSRAKLLVLLSDGFPEDTDYGQDKHTPTYGLRDTMMALREAEKSGILSFCLTVDKGGHDYLREMCAPSRYMVIEDINSLPAELPKIYQRHIRSREV